MENSRLDRTDGHILNRADLVIGQAVVKGHANRRPLSRLEPLKAGPHPRRILGGFDHSLRRRGVIDRLGHFFDECHTGGPAYPIHEFVAGNGENPGTDRSSAAEFSRIPPNLEHGVMEDVIGCRAVAATGPDKGVKRVVMAFYDGLTYDEIGAVEDVPVGTIK
ncbi:MAG: hypothetical protein AAFV96_00220, partial [Pseudomonadota bacterium]